jgi:hypothetical protein
LGRIEREFLTSPVHHARVDGLVRASERNSGFSTLSMDGHHDMTFTPSEMFITIDAAPLLDQPFSKRSTFHCRAPCGSAVFGPAYELAHASDRHLDRSRNSRVKSLRVATCLPTRRLAFEQSLLSTPADCGIFVHAGADYGYPG